MTSLLDHDDPPTSERGRVVALAGNPRPGSRTLLVARTVAATLAARLQVPGGVTALDLADVAAELFAADVEAHFDSLQVYDAPELQGDEWTDSTPLLQAAQ